MITICMTYQWIWKIVILSFSKLTGMFLDLICFWTENVGGHNNFQTAHMPLSWLKIPKSVTVNNFLKEQSSVPNVLWPK